MLDIIEAIKRASIHIYNELKLGETELSKNKNTSGDEQLKIDVISDDIIEYELRQANAVKAIISEEKEELKTINPNGRYLVGYDPIDGSSLIDVNQSVGSIFGIYENDFSGVNLRAAAYAIYGPKLELVIAV
ncbi:MAG: fructose-bisphosphatase class I, partial [Campylobacterales bacterium]|nr:fructose-bisphosphatase class I [Campylobacterales bacterium]